MKSREASITLVKVINIIFFLKKAVYSISKKKHPEPFTKYYHWHIKKCKPIVKDTKWQLGSTAKKYQAGRRPTNAANLCIKREGKKKMQH